MAPVRRQLQGGRWIPVENQHLTLKFLGATPADRLRSVADICARVASARRPSPIALEGAGAFPSRRRVRVLWIGIADPGRLLSALASDLDAGFEPLGYAPETRAFTPHLTLARFDPPARLGSLPTLDLGVLPPFEVDGVELYRSRLSPKGARYEMMERFPLAQPGGEA